MKKTMWISLIIFGGLLLGIVVLVIVVAIRQGVGRPIRYELPPGYRGWVLIEYENPSCPSLVTKGMYLVISIPSSGRACTSSPVPKGWRYSRYEYLAADGQRTTIPSGGQGKDNQIWASSHAFAQETVRFPRDRFFVGTKEELEKSWSKEPDVRDKETGR